MTLYYLPQDCIAFPPVEDAEPDGLLALGGDLSVPRLLAAYARGIFPWYNEGVPILWWSPDPRLILEPREYRISHRLRRFLNQRRFSVTVDTAFGRVIRGCAQAERPQGPGTWIIDDMVTAYIALHRAGHAHSVEVWAAGDEGGELLGAIYGVSLGRAFFGESMFFRRPNFSKVALAYLVRLLRHWEFHFLDCQQTTAHMLGYGAREIPRTEFRDRLESALEIPAEPGPWSFPVDMDRRF